jgi:hypothetical protein
MNPVKRGRTFFRNHCVGKCRFAAQKNRSKPAEFKLRERETSPAISKPQQKVGMGQRANFPHPLQRERQSPRMSLNEIIFRLFAWVRPLLWIEQAPVLLGSHATWNPGDDDSAIPIPAIPTIPPTIFQNPNPDVPVAIAIRGPP